MMTAAMTLVGILITILGGFFSPPTTTGKTTIGTMTTETMTTGTTTTGTTTTRTTTVGTMTPGTTTIGATTTGTMTTRTTTVGTMTPGTTTIGATTTGTTTIGATTTGTMTTGTTTVGTMTPGTTTIGATTTGTTTTGTTTTGTTTVGSGWTLVLKANAYFNAQNPYSLWTETGDVNEGNAMAMSMRLSRLNFKSSIVDEWENSSIKAVRVSFILEERERAYVVFNGSDSNKTNWFNKSKILYSSWQDLNATSSANYGSIDGHTGCFCMRSKHDDRDTTGWFVLTGKCNNLCNFSGKSTVGNEIQIQFSNKAGKDNFKEYSFADVFAIWVYHDQCIPCSWGFSSSCSSECLCSRTLLGNSQHSCLNATSICDPSICNNEFICTKTCECVGEFYGPHCRKLDGGWSSWSDWGPCSETCGGGIQSKNRACTNPSPQYGGADCANSTSTATANQTCNISDCPIDGGWSSWSNWGPCSQTCGGGIQSKNRTCTNPLPQYGGADCANSTSTATANQTCNISDCPIVCPENSAWTCSCKNDVINVTTEELMAIIEALKAELTVDKKQTSLRKRKKTSAKDSRTSAKAIGVLGAVMLAVPFVLIILLDLSTFYQYLCKKFQKRRISP